MNAELFKVLSEYEVAFDDGFPMYQIGGDSPEKVIEIIKECIDKKQDVYKLGYLSEDDNLLY